MKATWLLSNVFGCFPRASCHHHLNLCSGYRPAWGGGFTFEEKHDIGQFYKHLKCYRKETLWKQRWPSQHLHQQESTPFFSVFECFADRIVCFVFFWGCDIEWFTQGHMYAKKTSFVLFTGREERTEKSNSRHKILNVIAKRVDVGESYLCLFTWCICFISLFFASKINVRDIFVTETQTCVTKS